MELVVACQAGETQRARGIGRGRVARAWATACGVATSRALTSTYAPTTAGVDPLIRSGIIRPTSYRSRFVRLSALTGTPAVWFLETS